MLCVETDNGFAYRSYTAAVLNVSIRLIGVDNFSRPKSQSAKNRKIDLPILEINRQKKREENPHKWDNMFYRSHTNEVHDKFRYDFENLETKYYSIFIFIS